MPATKAKRLKKLAAPILLASLVVAAGLFPPGSASAVNCAKTQVGFTPLTDLGPATYKGAQGGLYPGGLNVAPPAHTAQGKQLAQGVVPRLPDGTPNQLAGKIVFMSIGMSNTSTEFRSFIKLAQADPQKDPRVLVVDGAVGGGSAEEFSKPNSSYWNTSDQQLSAAGGSARQVQAVWLKETLKHPSMPFPTDATVLRDDLASIVRILKQRFPNLWLVYLSSRIYAGYADTTLSPEPYAYQTGFAVKWIIQDQLQGKLPVSVGGAPWLGWGPYMWADGMKPRSDGLTWACKDFGSDGTHPSAQGADKVAHMLLDFVHSDPTASVWYTGSSVGLVGTLLARLCGPLPIC